MFDNLGARYTFVKFKHVGNLVIDGSKAVFLFDVLPVLVDIVKE